MLRFPYGAVFILSPLIFSLTGCLYTVSQFHITVYGLHRNAKFFSIICVRYIWSSSHLVCKCPGFCKFRV